MKRLALLVLLVLFALPTLGQEAKKAEKPVPPPITPETFYDKYRELGLVGEMEMGTENANPVRIKEAWRQWNSWLASGTFQGRNVKNWVIILESLKEVSSTEADEKIRSGKEEVKTSEESLARALKEVGRDEEEISRLRRYVRDNRVALKDAQASKSYPYSLVGRTPNCPLVWKTGPDGYQGSYAYGVGLRVSRASKEDILKLTVGSRLRVSGVIAYIDAGGRRLGARLLIQLHDGHFEMVIPGEAPPPAEK